ncbi:MAG: hypothetical protein LBC19_03510 [Tannerella sp.]|jgi:hypothetical protein|nr:hypothetical protein [Tannerella sp.]
MNRICIKKILATVGTSLLGITVAAQAADKPNIIIILTDDIGFGNVGVYDCPNMD